MSRNAHSDLLSASILLMDQRDTAIRERDEARAELAETEAVIAVWRGRTKRAEKERDEARAEIERLKTYIANNISLSKAEAEQRGYRRGVEDAAKALVGNPKFDEGRRTILALLEQKSR